MAIRRPSVYSQNQFVFQDFAYASDPPTECRYLLAKYDGEPFTNVSETFDYSSPVLKGGSIVARVDYTVEGKLITIDHWEVFWRDEWPLRLAVQFLTNCLYSGWQGYAVRVRKEAYAFWTSEKFVPLSNDPKDFLIYKG